jgi:hypothetical protein
VIPAASGCGYLGQAFGVVKILYPDPGFGLYPHDVDAWISFSRLFQARPLDRP